MKRFFGMISTIILIFGIIGCSGAGGAGDSIDSAVNVVLDSSYYTNKYNYTGDGILGRGINMGNFLEAPLVDGGEGAWTGGRLIQAGDFTIIKNAGFKNVRIPIRWSDYANDAGEIDATFKARVKTVVDWAIGADLKVIINVHHYEAMMNSADAHTLIWHQTRLKGIWSDIMTQFPIGDYPADKLYFELLNEPNGRVGYTEWNTIIGELVPIIRLSSADRKTIIGTANWGGIPGLYHLSLPDGCTSTNTIITIHYYEPFHFTHQGAEWVDGSSAWIGTTWNGTSEEVQAIKNLYNSAETAVAATLPGAEVYVGEFGAYTKYSNTACQQAWTACVSREAEAKGYSWAYWEFCSGFGAYDLGTSDWKPALIQGLMP